MAQKCRACMAIILEPIVMNCWVASPTKIHTPDNPKLSLMSYRQSYLTDCHLWSGLILNFEKSF